MQGKEWNQQEVIEMLRPYLQLGMSVNKACASAGIPQSTVQTWLEGNDELRLKFSVWQREVNNEAYRVWRDKVKAGDYIATKDWLERREKDDFSQRSELTGKDGEQLQGNTIIFKEFNEADRK